MSSVWVLLGLLACSVWMAAIGWYVGLVHYPAFLRVAPEHWSAFHAMHSANTGILVVGPMLAQLALACALPLCRPQLPTWLIAFSFACLVFSFGWTMVVSGPIHGRISTVQDVASIQRLIETNWVRALAWTLHGAVAAFGLWITLSSSHR